MSEDTIEPTEDDDIDCHLQKVGMGTLICKAAKQTGDKTTNEVNPTICFNCPAGKIYREVCCDAVLPKVQFYTYMRGASQNIDSLFCKIRKRETTLDYCRSCNLVTAESTRVIVTKTRSLFETQGFFSAYKDLEKARTSIRDGKFDDAITSSNACLESTMRICHEKLEIDLPKKKQVTDLWKSTRVILKFEEMDSSGSTLTLLNALNGVITHLGGLRNSLGDAHGKGLKQIEVSESIAELSLNIASSISTMILRRFIQINNKEEEG